MKNQFLALVLIFAQLVSPFLGAQGWNENPTGYEYFYRSGGGAWTWTVSFDSPPPAGSIIGGGGGGGGGNGLPAYPRALYYAPNSGPPGAFPTIMDRPAPNLYSGVGGNSELDKAYHQALVTSLLEGAGPAMTERNEKLKQLMAKYGGTGSAVEGLTKETAAHVKLEVERLSSIAKDFNRPSPLRPPRGMEPDAFRTQLTPLIQGAENRSVFEIAEGVDNYLAQSSRILPEYRDDYKNAIAGVFTNRDGLITGLSHVGAPPKLYSNWSSPQGLRLRSSLNRAMAAQQMVEVGFQSYCKSNSATECTALAPSYQKIRENYADLALGHILADRLAVMRQDPAFNVLMGALADQAQFTYGVAKGFVDSGVELAKAFKTLATDPLGTSKAMVSGIANAVIHYDVTWKAVKGVAGESWQTVLYGTAQQRGELVGKLTFEIASSMVGGSIAKVGLNAAKVAVGKTLVHASIVVGVENSVRLGRFTESVGNSIVAVSRVIPDTLTTLSAGSIDNLAALGSRVGQKFNLLSPVLDDRLAVAVAKNPEAVAGLLKNSEWVTETLPKVLETGSAMDNGALKLFDRTQRAVNEFPANQRYARVVHKDFADGIVKGENLLSAKSVHKEAFITAYDDVAGMTSKKAVAERLSLMEPDGVTFRTLDDHVLVEFKMENPLAGDLHIRTPHGEGQPFRYKAFMDGGRTKGQAREWVIDQDASLGDLLTERKIIPLSEP